LHCHRRRAWLVNEWIVFVLLRTPKVGPFVFVTLCCPTFLKHIPVFVRDLAGTALGVSLFEKFSFYAFAPVFR
jgi:hypothetical protein